VLRMFDHSQREVDVFVRYHIPFAELWANSQLIGLGNGVARIAALEHILRAKRITGRPHDLQDIEGLLALEVDSPEQSRIRLPRILHRSYSSRDADSRSPVAAQGCDRRSAALVTPYVLRFTFYALRFTRTLCLPPHERQRHPIAHEHLHR